MNTILIGLAGAGGLALIFTLYSQFMNGDKSKFLNILSKFKQKEVLKEISTLNEKQKIIGNDIKNKEKLSKESVEKIKVIQKEASKDINKILNEENLVNTDKEIDKLWEDI